MKIEEIEYNMLAKVIKIHMDAVSKVLCEFDGEEEQIKAHTLFVAIAYGTCYESVKTFKPEYHNKWKETIERWMRASAHQTRTDDLMPISLALH